MSNLKEKSNAAKQEYYVALAAFEFNRITFKDLILASNAAEVAYDKWLDSVEGVMV